VDLFAVAKYARTISFKLAIFSSNAYINCFPEKNGSGRKKNSYEDVLK
jgi:hypothetical protein